MPSSHAIMQQIENILLTIEAYLTVCISFFIQTLENIRVKILAEVYGKPFDTAKLEIYHEFFPSYEGIFGS